MWGKSFWQREEQVQRSWGEAVLGITEDWYGRVVGIMVGGISSQIMKGLVVHNKNWIFILSMMKSHWTVLIGG